LKEGRPTKKVLGGIGSESKDTAKNEPLKRRIDTVLRPQLGVSGVYSE